jgi:hypothetical protein
VATDNSNVIRRHAKSRSSNSYSPLNEFDLFHLESKIQSNEPAHKKRQQQSVPAQFRSIFMDDSVLQPNQDECEHYLKIGCHTESGNNDYSITKKCSFSFNDELANNKRDIILSMDTIEKRDFNNNNNKAKVATPVIESEASRICLAYWPVRHPARTTSKTSHYQSHQSSDIDYDIDDNDESDHNNNNNENSDLEAENEIEYVVLSKSMNSPSFTITCSVFI